VNLLARIEGGGAPILLDGRETKTRAATAVLVHGGVRLAKGKVQLPEGFFEVRPVRAEGGATPDGRGAWTLPQGGKLTLAARPIVPIENVHALEVSLWWSINDRRTQEHGDRPPTRVVRLRDDRGLLARGARSSSGISASCTLDEPWAGTLTIEVEGPAVLSERNLSLSLGGENRSP
jgi:hypothetical protein